MKKIIAVLSLLAIIISLAGCGKTPKEEPLMLEDAEAVKILEKLIPLSEKINDIFYGKGLEYEDTGEENVIYMPVKKDSPYQTADEIKKEAEKVYSKAYLSGVYTMMFDGVKSENNDGVTDFSADPRYKEIGGKLYVNITYEPFKLETKCLPETAKVTERTADHVTVLLECTGRNIGEIELDLVLDGGEWRLDTPTY